MVTMTTCIQIQMKLLTGVKTAKHVFEQIHLTPGRCDLNQLFHEEHAHETDDRIKDQAVLGRAMHTAILDNHVLDATVSDIYR